MLSFDTVVESDLLAEADRLRQEASRGLDQGHRSALGQFFTPAPTARLMASMASSIGQTIRLLDPGAGSGILTAALVAEICRRAERPREVALTAYECDGALMRSLAATLASCQRVCEAAGIACRVHIHHTDFIEAAVNALEHGLWSSERPAFDLAILNPPYKKFRADSRPRQLLRRLGVETSNLYTAFLSLVVPMLTDGGELIAITPRSFCNGPYFREFRQRLLRSVSLTRLHVFESRDDAFREDEVLQENVILHARKGVPQQRTVVVSQARNAEDNQGTTQVASFDRVVQTNDPESFIHLVPDAEGHELADAMRALPCNLAELGLAVSTGRVVDFRARHWLRDEPAPGTAPLIYPAHFSGGYVAWPKPASRKPNGIASGAETLQLLVRSGVYVLAKRFSSKEEPRRVVAAIFDPDRVPGELVGFENHLNYFHAVGAPLDRALAIGLAAYLNSTQLDSYFRQFNGHTQVNATDLRALRYPARTILAALGERIGDEFPGQHVLDGLVDDMIQSTPR